MPQWEFRMIRGRVEDLLALPNVIVVSSRCAMHQLQIALCLPYRARLLRNGSHMKRLRELMHQVLTSKFEIVYSAPDQRAEKWALHPLDFCYMQASFDDDDDPGVVSNDDDLLEARMPERMEERRAFTNILNGNYQCTGKDHHVWHHCDMNCDCISEADFLDRAHAELDALILETLPELAAMNMDEIPASWAQSVPDHRILLHS